MKVLLFGAGASYGSDTAGTPPLGAALFETLRIFNPPGWGRLPESLAEIFRDDFERGMTQLAQTNSHSMPILQRAMAAFFFNFRPGVSSLYLQLAHRISRIRWTGAIGSLNYERLLELSLSQFGVQPVVGSAAQPGQVELCLPHGCCHLFCEGARMAPVGVSFSGVGLEFDGPIRPIGDPVQFWTRLNGDGIPPAMSYFEPNKTTSSGRSFIEQQRQRWRELAAMANTVAIVGLKVRPGDDHIWGPLAETRARLVYCSGTSGCREFSDWASAQRSRANDVILNGYFAAEFESICREVDLD